MVIVAKTLSIVPDTKSRLVFKNVILNTVSEINNGVQPGLCTNHVSEKDLC